MNPSLHIICGKCGSGSHMLSFEFQIDGNCDEEGVEYPAVSIICGNCTTITHLDEIMLDMTDWNELNLTNEL